MCSFFYIIFAVLIKYHDVNTTLTIGNITALKIAIVILQLAHLVGVSANVISVT